MGCRVDLLRNFLSISQLLEQVLRLALAESVDEFFFCISQVGPCTTCRMTQLLEQVGPTGLKV